VACTQKAASRPPRFRTAARSPVANPGEGGEPPWGRALPHRSWRVASDAGSIAIRGRRSFWPCFEQLAPGHPSLLPREDKQESVKEEGQGPHPANDLRDAPPHGSSRPLQSLRSPQRVLQSLRFYQKRCGACKQSARGFHGQPEGLRHPSPNHGRLGPGRLHAAKLRQLCRLPHKDLIVRGPRPSL